MSQSLSLARNRWIPITPNTPPTTTPPQPATRSARNRSFVIPQTMASNMRPPSTGNPGSAFNPAKSRLRTARFPKISDRTPSVLAYPTPKTPARTSVLNGPAAEIRNEVSGPRSPEWVSV